MATHKLRSCRLSPCDRGLAPHPFITFQDSHMFIYSGLSQVSEVIIMGRGRPPRCPSCGESRSVSKGKRVTKTLGVRRIRLCKACGKKFTPRTQKPIDPAEPVVPPTPGINREQESMTDLLP